MVEGVEGVEGVSSLVLAVRRAGLVRGGGVVVCGCTWLHVVPAAGLAAAARRSTLTGVVRLLSWTVHVLLHTLYPLGRAVHTHTHTHTHTHRKDNRTVNSSYSSFSCIVYLKVC